MDKNYLFMAFSEGREQVESEGFKRYTGVAPVKIIAVNPSKEELEKIYNTTYDKEPEYTGVQNDMPYARIDFIVKTIPEKSEGIDVISRLSFFLRKEYRFNRDKTKIQIIDKYGRTAWATKEEADKHAIPQYASGAANISPDYKPCHVGEEDLINFIKTYFNIPNVMEYINGKWVEVENKEECEAYFNDIEKFFNNDFSELKSIPFVMATRSIKVLFGVRTTDDGKEYQTIYSQMFLRPGASDYSKLDAEIQSRKAAGALQNITYEVSPIHEYKAEPTDVESMPLDEEAPKGWF